MNCICSLPRETQDEIRAFEADMARHGKAIQAAELSLVERVKEFVQDFGLNGSKTGRADYQRLVPLDRIERLRIALDELSRVRATRPEPQDSK